MSYAVNTSVPVERSKAEIESLLMRYGAQEFFSGHRSGLAVVGFEMRNRRVQFVVPLPSRESEEFTHTGVRGLRRDTTSAFRAWERACRQRWRALALVIKAKLEAVERGITELDSEFLAHFVLPNGSTIGQVMKPKMDRLCATGDLPPLLPGE